MPLARRAGRPEERTDPIRHRTPVYQGARQRGNGPYGFHPLGPELDAAIIEGVRRADANALLAIAPAAIRPVTFSLKGKGTR